MVVQYQRKLSKNYQYTLILDVGTSSWPACILSFNLNLISPNMYHKLFKNIICISETIHFYRKQTKDEPTTCFSGLFRKFYANMCLWGACLFLAISPPAPLSPLLLKEWLINHDAINYEVTNVRSVTSVTRLFNE